MSIVRPEGDCYVPAHPPRRHSPPGGEFTEDCGGAIFANSHTSCPFAQNVLEQYQIANPKERPQGPTRGCSTSGAP